MEIVLLGTGNPLPDPRRAGPASLVRAAGRDLLFDAGRGVLLRAAEIGIGAPRLDSVYLTHLHSDHLTDLNDLITTRWTLSFAPSPLEIYGPVGTAAVVDAILSSRAADIGYRMAHHRDLTEGPQVLVTEVTPGTTIERGEVTIRVGATEHKPVHPSIGFRVQAADKSVVIAGDTLPCEGLDELCRSADAYVQTVLRADLVRNIGVPRFLDVLDYHSSVEQAAQTARRCGVDTLVLTHYIPSMAPGTEEEWLAPARAHFSGRVVLGDDLLTVSLD